MQDLETMRFERLSVQPSTGPDGRFQIKGLIPGVSYNVDAIKNDTTNYSDRFLGTIGGRDGRSSPAKPKIGVTCK